jgi:hypothetical protein
MRPLCRVCPPPGVKLRISRRNGPRRNPQNGVEGIHRIEAAVKTKYELVEVGLQMMRLDPAVMGAIDPRLQIGEDKMDHRQVLLRLLRVTPEREGVMPVAHFAKVAVPLPAVSADNGACRYVFLDECGECIGIATRNRAIRLFGAGDDAESEAPRISEFLDRDAAFVGIFPLCGTTLGILALPDLNSANNRRLMMNSLPFTPRAPANATFVYFDGMRRADCIAVWAHHTGAEFVKHRERRFITGDPKLALKLDGGLAWRLRRHEVSAPKPSRERHMARLHYRPSGKRRIYLTGTTAQHNRRTGWEPVRLADDPALRAREAIRPPDCLQVAGASAIIGKDALKLWKARWEGCIHGSENSTGAGICQSFR